METYKQLKERQQKEVNEFPFGAAFSKEQFEEMRQKLPLADGDKYVSLGAGMFVRKQDLPAMEAMFKRHKKEICDFRKNSKNLVSAFVREMHNHEYIYAEDDATILSLFGYTLDDLDGKSDISKTYAKAIKQYFEEVGDAY